MLQLFQFLFGKSEADLLARGKSERINVYYDRLTAAIFERVITKDAVCVDVGCHKGNLAQEMLLRARTGKVYGFEPLPHLFAEIQKRFASDVRVELFDCALADSTGETSFNYVITNPGYSGILKRRYDREHEEDKSITVQLRKLDDVLQNTPRLDLIKIDVEGAEMLVLKGATHLIQKFKPTIVFECGLGGSDRYGTNGAIVFDFFKELNMSVYLMQDFLTQKKPLLKAQLEEQFDQCINFYFVAAPTR